MSDDKTPELLPCPFCGSRAQLVSYTSCDCCGKAYNAGVACTGDCNAIVDHYDTDGEAIAAWNKRTPPAEDTP